jgi:hypothetical protein
MQADRKWLTCEFYDYVCGWLPKATNTDRSLLIAGVQLWLNKLPIWYSEAICHLEESFKVISETQLELKELMEGNSRVELLYSKDEFTYGKDGILYKCDGSTSSKRVSKLFSLYSPTSELLMKSSNLSDSFSNQITD